MFVSPEDLPIFSDHLLPNLFSFILFAKWIDFILYSPLTLFRLCYLILNGQRFSLWINSFLIAVKQRQNLTFYLFLSVQFSGIKYIHIQYATITTVHLQNIFIIPNWTSYPLKIFLIPSPLAPANLYSMSFLYKFDYSRYLL